jgi:EAL domain-containing protein (putative c-di-GMP-specific phosphodiesterase class I)
VNDSEREYTRLRTEWLRLNNHLHDALTGLPTLPAVVEDIRKLLGDAGALDILYLDLGRSGQREAEVGWEEHDATIRRFAARLLELRERGELGAPDILCVPSPRSDRMIVFLAASPGEPGPRMPGRVERLVAMLCESSSGDTRAAPACGHARVLREPMARSERSVQRGLTRAILMALRDRGDRQVQLLHELDEMIERAAVRTVYHPIVRIDDLSSIGFEALTRPSVQHSFESVEALFAFAEGTDRLLAFEAVCRRQAIRSATSPGLLFLNCSARALEDPEWRSPELQGLLAESGRVANQVVVEVTERVAVRRDVEFRAALRGLRERGFRLAIDDMGAGHSTLQTLADLEPDFLKFDVSLVRDIHRSRIKQSLLESLRSLAGKIRARVIAEGVESEAERVELRRLGIELGQGLLFRAEEVGGR